MKKKRIYLSALALLCTAALFAQGEMDAFRFSHLDLNGSARSMSMGGAFGALGGDMSAMSHNPAGIGVYRSSEVQGTVDLKMSTMSSSWTGINTDKNKTNFGFDNFSYVGYFPTGKDVGVKSWNIGLSYNKIKDFNRQYRAVGSNLTSLADYVASQASHGIYKGEVGLPESALQDENAYYNNDLGGYWLSIIGSDGPGAGFFGNMYNQDGVYHSAFGDWNQNKTKWNTYKPNETVLNISERGSISEYNFSVANNISDRIFLGATFAIEDIDYRMSSYHDEYFDYQGSNGNYYTDELKLDNAIETEGTGYSFNLGVIVRPVDMLRVGIAYNSPKWYRMTDYYYATAETYINGYDEPEMWDETPQDSYSEYKLRTPGRWIFSAAGVFGTSALLSIDYELTDYKSMHLSNRNGNGYEGDNQIIKDDFTFGHTVKIGGEYKVTPQFAVRAGYIWQPSPMKKVLTSNNRDDLSEVFPVGTIPHYSVLKSTNHITVGLGYRFTPNFYMDLACIYRIQKQNLYPFSNMYYEEPEYHLEEVVSTPANVDAKTTRVALTFGYKF